MLPDNPTQIMKNIAVWQDLPLSETHNTPTVTTNNYSVNKLPTITEANQWIINNRGL